MISFQMKLIFRKFEINLFLCNAHIVHLVLTPRDPDVAKNIEFNRVPNSDVAKNAEFNRFRTQMWLKTQNLTGSELRCG